MGVLGCLFLIAFNIRFCIVHNGKGVPALPNMLPEDELELATPFGAMNLDEASNIVGLDKEVLFKRLADPDPTALMALLSMVNTEKLEETLAQHSAEDMIKMLEAQPELEEEDDDEDASSLAAPRNVPQEVAAGTLMVVGVEDPGNPGLVSDIAGAKADALPTSSQSATPQELASALRELFRKPASEERKDVLQGSRREKNQELRWRALGECLDTLVKEGDAEGCKLFLMEVPVEDLWESMKGMEDWMDEKRQKEMDKKFNKLVPPKVFAGMMRQNPQLKDLVSRLMKREVQRTKDRFKAKMKKST
eukprot:gnl/MRDRNA2_/MRDRNA2_177754_c0_seq1.p1 gnl/MRDRNA2_/MRDRNA2_177754_c0~~gnl/MRDRNA2_/MRDRNA2_177754_c0_seq1.p1  ORF type:complete len:346 (-),score=105.75 gnl/MRDRNA2_/MRDRNA2_177754_c0_seq1:701-1618(-)